MAFASQFPGMLCFASCAALLAYASSSGCIATSTIEFEPEENFPPSIVSQPGADFPLNEIGQINADPLPPGEPAEMPLQVIIRDPNVDQTLEYRIFLDSLPPAPEFPFDQGEILPESGSVERPNDFFIPYDSLTPAGVCHKIELVVVGEFASFVEPRRPVQEGDVDQATWWVEVTDSDNLVIVQECR